MPVWPRHYTVNRLDTMLEYIYEILRGSRLATTSQLDVCENAFSSFFESWDKANQYLSLALEMDSIQDIIEGILRHFDALTWVFPMLIGCDLSSRYVKLNWIETVIPNAGNLPGIIARGVRNSTFLTWDIFVFITDIFFSDYYSFAFWAGDVFYLLMVKD